MAVSTASSSPVRYAQSQYDAGGAKPSALLCILGSKTYTLAGFDALGTVVIFEEHALEGGSTSIAQNPLLTANRSSVRVLVADERQLVIPEDLYDAGAVDSWMQSCFFRMPDEEMVVTRVSGAPYRVATVAVPQLAGLQQGVPPVTGIYALGAALLQAPPLPEGPCARVMLTAEVCMLALWNNAQLLASVVYPETDAESVVYRLLGLLNQNRLESGAVQVAVDCLSPGAEGTAAVLDAYVAVIRSEAIPEATGDGFPYGAVARALSRVRACVL